MASRATTNRLSTTEKRGNDRPAIVRTNRSEVVTGFVFGMIISSVGTAFGRFGRSISVDFGRTEPPSSSFDSINVSPDRSFAG